jgi:hypothetical protein
VAVEEEITTKLTVIVTFLIALGAMRTGKEIVSDAEEIPGYHVMVFISPHARTQAHAPSMVINAALRRIRLPVMDPSMEQPPTGCLIVMIIKQPVLLQLAARQNTYMMVDVTPKKQENGIAVKRSTHMSQHAERS